MKTILSFILLSFFWVANSQDDNCFQKIKEYQDLLRVQKYPEAYTVWSQVRQNCQKSSEIYSDGKTILQYKIDIATTIEDKEILVRDFMKLYDQEYKYFPETSQDYEVSKAMLLNDNKVEVGDEVFNLIDSNFLRAPKSITNASAIYIYFDKYLSKFKAGDKKIIADMVLDKYDQVSILLNDLMVSNATKIEEYKIAFRSVTILSKDISTCENLTRHYQKNSEVNKDNKEWLLAAVTNLSGKCNTQPIFFNLAQRLHSISPSSQSAHFMAIASIKQKNNVAALQYYNESADLQLSPEEKSRTYYSIASTIVSNDNVKSKEYLNKAIVTDPNNGRPYIFLAQLYANSAESCGTTEFEKKAIYYLAAQTVKKAEIATPKLKGAVDSMLSKFNEKSPSMVEISKQKLKGKSFRINCWINETITFPSK